nr:PREDICTED: protein FAM161A isoform X2 [Anolis carolinensis]|eukprot:XP_008112601.1 PREDICTED: protein FAM161A isoform X2 [Anolis carolinensis]
MDASHRAASLAVSCLRRPVDPRTRAPIALYEREREDGAWQQNNLHPEREQSSDVHADCKDWADISKMYLSNQEYYLKLEELKNAHQETMAKLENMYQNKLYLKGVEPLTNTDMANSTSYRKHEKQRMKEYLQELEEMEERVEKRPLLLEQATQKNARIAAEKLYSDTLRELGLCEEFVSKKGQSKAEMLLQGHSRDDSEISAEADIRSDNEDKTQDKESPGAEEKSETESIQSYKEEVEEEEEEEEKEEEEEDDGDGEDSGGGGDDGDDGDGEIQSDHGDQDAPADENENNEEDSGEEPRDYQN